ncbi:MAG: 2OG-Fe(II) oxygenase [Aliivibrio sp.]|nr:2OG-Fe(II) oxygenase [Aliivibrio sp.]
MNNVTFIDDPYPIWIIDNFLEDECIKQIKANWLPNEHHHWHGGHTMVAGEENILEQKMLSISKSEHIPTYIRSVLIDFHSEKFTKEIEEITGISDLVRDESMRWSGMRVMRSGSYQLIHSDARKHPENDLRKEITCLLYINDDDYNKERDGGCLEIWDDSMSECKHQIEPINNRFVMFQNSDTSYHGVPFVNRDRKAILFSVLKNANCTDRNFAEFVSRPNDSESVKIQGKKRGEGK